MRRMLELTKHGGQDSGGPPITTAEAPGCDSVDLVVPAFGQHHGSARIPLGVSKQVDNSSDHKSDECR